MVPKSPNKVLAYLNGGGGYDRVARTGVAGCRSTAATMASDLDNMRRMGDAGRPPLQVMAKSVGGHSSTSLIVIRNCET